MKTNRSFLRTLALIFGAQLCINCACSESPKKNEARRDTQKTFEPQVGFNGIISLDENFSLFETDYRAMTALGATATQTAAPWRSVETAPGTFNWSILTNGAFGLSALHSYGIETVFLNISVIAMGSRSLPDDISTLPLDSNTVRDRLNAYIDALIPQLTPQVKYLSLGNEVNYYLEDHPSEWASYKTLIEGARTHVKLQRPDLMVGLTLTFRAATEDFRAEAEALYENMDFVALNYYPKNEVTFIADDPSVVPSDFQKALDFAGSKPLVFQEIGYHTNEDISGSEAKQAEFVRQVFASWRAQGTDRIPFMSFFKFRDWTEYDCANRYKGSGPPIPSTSAIFKHLCSLGFLKTDRTPKLSLEVIQTELSSL